MGMIACENCGYSYINNRSRCVDCGRMVCYSCRKEDWKFCNHGTVPVKRLGVEHDVSNIRIKDYRR